MSIKDLFSNKPTTMKTADSASVDIESPDFLEALRKQRDEIEPPIDFASASNFVRFGSAKEYYVESIKRVYNTYPYDGSEKEKIEYDLSSSYLDRYIYNTKYPKRVGYADFSSDSYIQINRGYNETTTATSTKLADLFKGKDAFYDSDNSRKQSFVFNLDDGITFEWWMNKKAFGTGKETLFELFSSNVKMDLVLTGTATPVMFYGSSSAEIGLTAIADTTFTNTTLADSSWKHYAVSIKNNTSNTVVDFYRDGVHKRTRSLTKIGTPTGNITGFLGSGSYGLLSASVDEFRYWNKKQTSEAIYNNYKSGVGGGANTDDYRKELSLYFKFNEGKTGVLATDRIVLDYSGRLSNGYWHNYNSSISRQSGSYLSTERGDPIVRSNHPSVQSLLTQMETSGSQYDANSNMMLYDLVPSWMRNEDEDSGEELKHIVQIIASYFDTLYAQIEFLPNIKTKKYYQDDEKPLPFARRLLEERGLVVSDILINRSIVEYFGQKDLNGIQYEKDLEELKNRIYHNIYNNLEYIYKSKGTEKAYRNMLRCFGIDDELVKLNLYTDNGSQYLTDKVKHTSQKTKHIDFDDTNNFSATIYQENFISGSGTELLEKNNAITLEAEVMVPKKPDYQDSFYYNTSFMSSSVFGLDSYSSQYNYGYELTGGIENNFQVYLARDAVDSDRAKWVLKQKRFALAGDPRTLDGTALSFMTASTANCSLTSTGSSGAINDFYSPGSSSAGTITDGITLSCWFKYQAHSDLSNEIMYIYKNTGNFTTKALGLRVDGIRARHGDSGYHWTGSTTIIPYDFTQHQGEWKHYVLSVSGVVENGVGFDFYVDGVRETIAVTSSMSLIMNNLGMLNVGGRSTRSLSGSIDDVLILTSSISPAEVSSLYNDGFGLSPAGVKALPLYQKAKAYWTFENSSDSGLGTTGVTFFDEVSNLTLEMSDTGDNPLNYITESHTYISGASVVPGTTTDVEVLTSSFYEDIYDNQRWNVAVKAYPKGYPFAGSFATTSNPNYILEFYGVSHNFDEVLHEFKVTASLPYETGSALLSTPKRVYVGARRTNWSGSVEVQSDVKIAAASLYYDKLDDQSIKQHNLDPSNYGHNRVFGNPTPFLNTATSTHLPAQHSLALHWDFQTVTGSDGSGTFTVEDFSSASVNGRYGWLGNIVTQEHKGKGFGFPASNTALVKNEFIFASKKELPEVSFTSDNITVVGQADEYLYEDEDISDNVFAFEKSMYQVVSQEMLNMFSTMIEYSNLFAKPVDRYRYNYKRLAHAKKLFFEKTSTDLDLDRFTSYYKWIDASISHFLQQLHPASAKFNKGIVETVESHILERPKYQHLLANIEEHKTIKDQPIRGINELTYDWAHGHSPDYKLEDYNQKAIKAPSGVHIQHANANQYAGTSSIAFWFNPGDLTTYRNIVAFGSNYKFNINGVVSNNRIFKSGNGKLTSSFNHAAADSGYLKSNLHSNGFSVAGWFDRESTYSPTYPGDYSLLEFKDAAGEIVYKLQFITDEGSPDDITRVTVRDDSNNEAYFEHDTTQTGTSFIGFSVSPSKLITIALGDGYGGTHTMSGGSAPDTTSLEQITSINMTRMKFLQDLTVWKKALTAAEFAELYNTYNGKESNFSSVSSSMVIDNWKLDCELGHFTNNQTIPINTEFSSSVSTSIGHYLTASTTWTFANDASPYRRYTSSAGLQVQKVAGSTTYVSNNIPLDSGTNFIVVTNDNLNNADSIKYNIQKGSPISGNVYFQTLCSSSTTRPDAITGDFQVGFGSSGDVFDEMSVWNKTLTNDDITGIYNSNIAQNLLNHQSASNLVSYYRFGDHPNDPPDRPYKGLKLKDSKGTYDLAVVGGTLGDYVAGLAGTTKIPKDDDIHCFWKKERKERGGLNSADREQLRKVITSKTYVEKIPSFGDNSGNIYEGSTYGLRRFSTPYSFSATEQRSIHGGINYATPKDRDLLKPLLGVHGPTSNDLPLNVVVIGVGEGQGLVDPDPCLDVLKSPTVKTKYNTTAIVGAFSTFNGDAPVSSSGVVTPTAEYLYNIKGERVFPFNMISGSETSGYNEVIDLNYKKNAILTNLHSDTTTITNEIPMQGPFTEAWVGGRQSRHIKLNDGTDGEYTRPEEWLIEVGEHPDEPIVDGAIGLVGPDYGGPYPESRRQWAIHYRDGRAKRPVNIQNISGSYTKLGNYNKNYEVVQTTGRLENNKVIKDLSDIDTFIARDIGLPATTHETSLIGVVPGSGGNVFALSSNRLTTEIKAFPTNSTGISSTDTVIATRFSAPGGYEVGSESFLDAYAKEYSVYNAISFRNLTVKEDSGEAGTIRVNSHASRREGLNTLQSRHCGKFGIDSKHGSVSSVDYSAEASFHKVHRNTRVTPTMDKALRMPPTGDTITGIITGDVQSVYPSSGYLSFSFWVKLDEGYSYSDSKRIAEADDNSNANVFYMEIDNDHLEIFPYSASGYRKYMTANKPTVGDPNFWKRWNHFVIIFNVSDISTTPTVYINGSSVEISLAQGGGITGAIKTIAGRLVLMGDDASASANELQGSLQHFAFYNKQLSQTEVTEIYNNKHIVNTSLAYNVIDYWQLGNEGEFDAFDIGASVTDGLSFDATIGNTSLTIDENVFISEGVEMTKDKNNNFYIQSTLPQSDYNYSWVDSSLGDNYNVRSGTQKVFGYWPKNGMHSSSVGFDSAITFPSASTIQGS